MLIQHAGLQLNMLYIQRVPRDPSTAMHVIVVTFQYESNITFQQIATTNATKNSLSFKTIGGIRNYV